MKKRITVSVISELTTDQRVIRICNTLQQMGFIVHVIAREPNNSLPLDTYNFSAKRIKCWFSKGFLLYAEFNLRLFFKLLFIKTDYLLANDLDTLVPNYMVSRLRSKSIFYDSHEYFTGVPELQNAPFKKKVWKFFENFIFPKLPVVYTVNESIKKIYQNEYGNKNISVIRNVPDDIVFTPIPKPEHWAGKKIMLMQGIGIHAGRGALDLIEMMRYLPRDYRLVFIGGGLLWNNLQQVVKNTGLENRVEMIAKVPPPLLRAYTSLADLGFSLDKPVSVNYEFSLPNKIFDYIHGGIPVAASPVVEVKKIIEQYGCGFCFSSNEPKLMAEEVKELMLDENRYKQLKQNAVKAAAVLNWKNEQEELIKIYRSFL
ncbi:MAG: glycosyltransferase [Niabella sp.]